MEKHICKRKVTDHFNKHPSGQDIKIRQNIESFSLKRFGRVREEQPVFLCQSQPRFAVKLAFFRSQISGSTWQRVPLKVLTECSDRVYPLSEATWLSMPWGGVVGDEARTSAPSLRSGCRTFPCRASLIITRSQRGGSDHRRDLRRPERRHSLSLRPAFVAGIKQTRLSCRLPGLHNGAIEASVLGGREVTCGGWACARTSATSAPPPPPPMVIGLLHPPPVWTLEKPGRRRKGK